MSEEIKPCPFCGSDKIDIISSSGAWFASCANKECGMMGFVESKFVYYEDILKKWNTRDSKETQLLKQALKESVEVNRFYGAETSWLNRGYGKAPIDQVRMDNSKMPLSDPLANDGQPYDVGGKKARQFLASESFKKVEKLL